MCVCVCVSPYFVSPVLYVVHFDICLMFHLHVSFRCVHTYSRFTIRWTIFWELIVRLGKKKRKEFSTLPKQSLKAKNWFAITRSLSPFFFDSFFFSSFFSSLFLYAGVVECAYVTLLYAPLFSFS